MVGDDEGNVLGFWKSNGECHSSMGIEYAMEEVQKAMKEALMQAGLEFTQMDMLVAGLTGMDWEYEEKLLRDALWRITHIENILVVNDCIIAMRAGSSHQYGIVLCAGSGLNCAARNKKGEEYETEMAKLSEEIYGQPDVIRKLQKGLPEGDYQNRFRRKAAFPVWHRGIFKRMYVGEICVLKVWDTCSGSSCF